MGREQAILNRETTVGGVPARVQGRFKYAKERIFSPSPEREPQRETRIKSRTYERGPRGERVIVLDPEREARVREKQMRKRVEREMDSIYKDDLYRLQGLVKALVLTAAALGIPAVIISGFLSALPMLGNFLSEIPYALGTLLPKAVPAILGDPTLLAALATIGLALGIAYRNMVVSDKKLQRVRSAYGG